MNRDAEHLNDRRRREFRLRRTLHVSGAFDFDAKLLAIVVDGFAGLQLFNDVTGFCRKRLLKPVGAQARFNRALDLVEALLSRLLDAIDLVPGVAAVFRSDGIVIDADVRRESGLQQVRLVDDAGDLRARFVMPPGVDGVDNLNIESERTSRPRRGSCRRCVDPRSRRAIFVLPGLPGSLRFRAAVPARLAHTSW